MAITRPESTHETASVGGAGGTDRSWRALKGAGLALAIPGVALLAGLGYVLYAILTSRTDVAAEHEAAKRAYLESIDGFAASGDLPNVLLVYYDDLGYGDLGFMGDTPIATPNLDALAADGVIMTDFHAPAAVCTPSRAALLTGRLAPRAGVTDVLFPSGSAMAEALEQQDDAGLTQEEITLPDILESSGYATGMIGKWHLGDVEGSLPNDFGFDSFLGSLYSNDMDPFQLYRDDEVVMESVDQSTLDALYTDEAVAFIDEASEDDEPFFLYLAHNFPHEPLAAAGENLGRSDAGLYGDVVEGLDDGIGRIVTALKETGQWDDTIIIVTSDNGPWFQGDAGDHRGRKGSISEGGMLVPFLVHWPAGLVGGRTIDAMAMGTDILPTLLDWLDIPAPTDRALDGTSLAPLLAGEADAGADLYYFYAGEQLLAVSDGRYKYYAEQPYVYVTSGASAVSEYVQGPWLFDLESDPSESYDVLDRNPEVGSKLAAAWQSRVAEMADNPRGWSR